MDRARFYLSIRPSLFGGRMSAPQVQGCEAILDGWEARGGGRRQWLSYMLATAFHETAATMQPIHERGGAAYFTRYDPPRKIAIELGNTRAGDGARYHGRGYVQLTGKRNYNRAGEALGIDLGSNPDRALDPKVAADIMFLGMSQAWFTGKKLKDYLNGDGIDFKNARRIINGTDRAALIAGYAEHFDEAILAAVPTAPPKGTSP